MGAEKMKSTIEEKVSDLIKKDKMVCGEMFAKIFHESVGCTNKVSGMLESKTKFEFMQRATSFAYKLKERESFRTFVALVNALPWDVPKEKIGTVEDEKTAKYLLVCVNFNYACMCKEIVLI